MTPAAKQLRRDRIGLVRPAAEPDVEIRRLGDYDTALGLDGLDVRCRRGRDGGLMPATTPARDTSRRSPT